MEKLLTLYLTAALTQAALASADVVISQVYGGGGNAGAVLRHDFVELLNRGTNAVDVTGWSVQYAAAPSSNWTGVPLRGAIEPGQYLLVQLDSRSTNGLELPAADVTGSLRLAADAGKVALLSSTVALQGSCPSRDTLVDFVGYGQSANCHEGHAPAPAPSATEAIQRQNRGCRDSDDNGSDFFATPPEPRNRASPRTFCSSWETPLPLHDIQGNGRPSPWQGYWVTTTTNIVTAITRAGVFLQAPDTEVDGDPRTSEAIVVELPTPDKSDLTIGDAVTAGGIVTETDDVESLFPRTHITSGSVTVWSHNQPLPEPLVLSIEDFPSNRAATPPRALEGMRVAASSVWIVSPTGGDVRKTNGQASSDGVFCAVLTGIPRPMREPGISVLEPLPPEAPAHVPRFDANPELLRVDSNGQSRAKRLEVTAGATITGMVGVLDRRSNEWTLLPDARQPGTVEGNRSAAGLTSPGPDNVSLASLNLQRFRDSEDDSSATNMMVTPAALAGRLRKASLAVRNVLGSPDILGLVEIENLTTLETLAGRIQQDALAQGQTPATYQAFLLQGNGGTTINLGFLVNTTRVQVRDVIQVGKTNVFVNPVNGEHEALNDRPPLVLRVTVPSLGATPPLELTVILNHLKSLVDIADPAKGPRVRAKRKAQAEFLAHLIQERQSSSPTENLVVLGDFNAFEFNDGYVDVMGTICGRPVPPDQVTLASPDLVGPDLLNLTEELPTSERYSYVFAGSAQAIDHILVSAQLRWRVSRHGYTRLNADFPESFRNDFDRPERLSDHDAPVVWLTLDPRPRFTRIAQRIDGAIELRWLAEPGVTNRVEASTDLQHWTTIGETIPASTGAASWTGEALPGVERGFFRVQQR